MANLARRGSFSKLIPHTACFAWFNDLYYANYSLL